MQGIVLSIEASSFRKVDPMRTFEYDIMPEIKERWSPRALSSEPIPMEDIRAIIEAAHYAPSCFNEQPWRFVVAHTPEALKPFHEALSSRNALWATKAPVLILICGHQKFAQSGKDNFYHTFDSGTAWGFLSLEAQRRGICTHGMAGFKKTMLRESLNIPEEWTLIALVAVGRYGSIDDLDETFLSEEQPNERRPIEEIMFEPYQLKEESK